MTDNPRAVIGDNQPPCPFQPHESHIGDLLELAEGTLTGGAIDSQEKADAIDELLASIKEAARELEIIRKAEKAPWDAGAKAVQDIAVPLASKLDTAKKVAQSALTPWRSAQQAIRDAEAKAARDLAARLEQEALAAFQASKPTDLDARFEADALADAAKKANAAANRVDRTATGLRTSWKATVTARKDFLQWLMVNQTDELTEWLGVYAQKLVTGGKRQLPGVLIEEVRTAT
jgi:hypothetical protein